VKNHQAFSLSNQKEKQLLEKEYIKQSSLYYKGQIPFSKILQKITNYSENF